MILNLLRQRRPPKRPSRERKCHLRLRKLLLLKASLQSTFDYRKSHENMKYCNYRNKSLSLTDAAGLGLSLRSITSSSHKRDIKYKCLFLKVLQSINHFLPTFTRCSLWLRKQLLHVVVLFCLKVQSTCYFFFY